MSKATWAVIRDGVEETAVVDYSAPDFVEVDAAGDPVPEFSPSISSNMCRIASESSPEGLFDTAYYEETVAAPFRAGEIGEAPVLPGSGMFMPAGSAAAKDKGLFRREVPVFDPEKCTGCLDCSMVCPDAAIPPSVFDIDALLMAAAKDIDMPEKQRDVIREYVRSVGDAVRRKYNALDDAPSFAKLVAEAVNELYVESAVVKGNLERIVEAVSVLPVAKTRPFFDAMEAEHTGQGGLFAVAIDPWKCTGCLECVDICGPGALVATDQDAGLLHDLQSKFNFLSKTPNTTGTLC